MLAHQRVVAAPANPLPKRAHIAAFERDHQFEIVNPLRGGPIRHLGHHVVLPGQGGGDQIKAGEGFKKLIVSGAARKGEVARRPQIDELGIGVGPLRQLGGGKKGWFLPAGACFHQRRTDRIHAVTIQRGPLEIVLRINGATEMAVDVAALGQPLHKGPQGGGALAVVLQPGRHSGFGGAQRAARRGALLGGSAAANAERAQRQPDQEAEKAAEGRARPRAGTRGESQCASFKGWRHPTVDRGAAAGIVQMNRILCCPEPIKRHLLPPGGG